MAAIKKAAAAAKKSAPAPEVEELVDDLLDDLGGVDGDVDLLDDIDEDDSVGWQPEEAGDGIQGVVVSRSQTRSNYAKEGEDPMRPTVTVETKAGEKFRIIGFSKVLGDLIDEQDPQPGDTFAVKYFGKRVIRKGQYAGNEYHNYGAATKRAR